MTAIDYKIYWDKKPTLCRACLEKIRTAQNASAEDLAMRTAMAEFVGGARRAYKKRVGDTTFHVTLEVEGGRVSGDIDAISGQLSNMHTTFYGYRREGGGQYSAKGEDIIVDWNRPVGSAEVERAVKDYDERHGV